MRNKRLSILMIMLLIFALVMPTASFAAPGASSKVFTSKLSDVAYKFNMDKIATQKITREKNANKEEQMKQHMVEGVQGSMSIEHNGPVQISAQSVAVFEPQNYVPVSDSSKTISVIVELQAEPLAPFNAKVKQGLMKANVDQKSMIDKEQANFKVTLSKGLNVKIHRTYEQVFNGFALEIAANKVDQLLQLPGVKAIYPDNEVVATAIDNEGILNSFTPMMDRSAPHIGADHFWEQGITGEGIKVGVLDTGIDYLHPDLADAYKGGYDLVDDDDDPYETTPIDWENDPTNPPAVNDRGREYWTSHGSHVAGTIAGRGVAPGGTKGVAPGADIYAYRVLGPYGSGSNAGVIAGIDRSVKDGMDVINLSLGSTSNNQYSADSIALNNAMLAGVVVAVSAGNSGPNNGTLTDPATSEMAISVGNSLPPTQAPSITADGLPSLSGNMMEYTPKYEAAQLEVVYVGLGEPGDFAGKDVTGKIALMQRGNISFHDKSVNAQKAGAAVAIIYNNAAGNFNGTMGEPGDYIPTLSLSQEDGLLLKNKFDADGPFVAELGYMLEVDYMNDSSSRGPARPGYDIKPDVAAPGTGIVSSVPAYGRDYPDADYSDAYAGFTGTSMAAPHIAGAAALLLDKYNGLSSFEVKSLIMNNAHKISDRDGNRYRHMDQGAGRVDLANSDAAKAVALVHETTTAVRGGAGTAYETGSLSFGYVGAGERVSKTITVKDFVGEASSYAITTQWYGGEAGTMSTSMTQVEVAANDSVDFTFNLDVSATATEKYYEGELVLTEAGGHVLQLPIGFYVGEPVLLDPVTDLELDPDIFSPNGDGVMDTTDIYVTVNQLLDYFSLDVHWWDGDWIGPIFETEDLDPGSYRLAGWNGVAYLYGFIPVKLPDDIYLMVPWYDDGSGDLDVAEDAVAPFIVVTKAPGTSLNDPEIVADDATNTGVISGTIDSSLLLDLIDEEILLNPISELFGAGVLYEEDGEWVQVDGIVDDEGNFAIQVPLKFGENSFEVYIYDDAGNGVLKPGHIVNYTLEGEDPGDPGDPEPGEPKDKISISVKAPDRIIAGKPFAVSVDFANAHDLYAMQFSLTYDGSLTKGTLEPSATLRAYQEAMNPGVNMIFHEIVTELEDGKVRSDYIISLLGDFKGYSGNGTFATFNFTSGTTGSFKFGLSGITVIGEDGDNRDIGDIGEEEEIIVVPDPTNPDPGDAYVVTGNIIAEAFRPGVDYSFIWYEGEDGTHRVVVEALDANGNVVAQGTVNADGSYRLSLPEGEYTVRVVVPGHFGAEASVSVDNNEVSFGPLVAGDINGDGVIDLVDLQLVAKQFGKKANEDGIWSDSKASAANITRSGEVDMMDISFILKNYGMRK